jgi:predicted nuclease of predicted toxin-antitoxin system
MDIIVDECLAESTIATLESLDFHILRIEDILFYGVEDENIMKYASEMHIPIITHDKRFGYIYLFSDMKPWTIVIIQVQSPHPRATNELLKSSFIRIDLEGETYQGRLINIASKNIRVRKRE